VKYFIPSNSHLGHMFDWATTRIGFVTRPAYTAQKVGMVTPSPFLNVLLRRIIVWPTEREAG
jgi:hypothetical protein